MTTTSVPQPVPAARRPRDRTHWLYIAVLVGMAAGIVVGFVAPDAAKELKPLGTGFVNIVKMMIQPIIFCTIILGVGSVRRAASVGRVGGLALAYFLSMSVVALGVGLVVGNIIHPGAGLNLSAAAAKSGKAAAASAPKESVQDFVLNIIPTSLASALTSGVVLQTLFVALVVGFAVQGLGARGEPALRAVQTLQLVVFKVLAIVMWAAPIGAFGAIASLVGATGAKALTSLLQVMLGFYATCLIFVFGILGALLWLVARISIWQLCRYLGKEFLLILSTSSSEVALPRLIAKMEHLGASRTVVGISVPTGYSFNLDGTMIYLTMGSLFIADAMNKPFSMGEQISLLLFMLLMSKGAAGVTGSGLAVLASGLSSQRPDLVDGVGLVVGIDRPMSEARSLTNFAGNAVATVLVATWTGEFDHDRARAVLSGRTPFDETLEVSPEQERLLPVAGRPEPVAG
ncbi:MAG TPA: cation:dicarboxylase symporter family transporter [Kineosporiaceae bacterium]